MSDERFGELRSLVNGPPSEAAWKRMVHELAHWTYDDHFKEVVMPYLEEHLATWPDELRVGPMTWVAPIARKTPKPAPLLPLARKLDLRDCRIGNKKCEYIVNASEIAHITAIDFSDNAGIRNDAGVAMGNSPHMANISWLNLQNCTIGNRGATAIAASEHLTKLTFLNMAGNDLGDAGCRALERSDNLPEAIRNQARSWYSWERDERERRYWDPWE